MPQSGVLVSLFITVDFNFGGILTSVGNYDRENLSACLTMFLSYSIPAEGVIVEARVLHQRYPLPPARGHIGAVVLIQILSKEG